MEMVPTRDGFGKGIVELGKVNKNIVVLCADLTDSTRASWFKKEFPDRFFGMGVAEQDMFSTAAGLALSGKIPYAATFGVFASGRAWDQIRVSISYMKLNVKIIGTHGGISVGPDGYTHQAVEEIALMRALPHMTMIVPCDFNEAKKATVEAASFPGPVYIRLGRSAIPVITKPEDDFKIGKGVVLKEGSDVTIIACGTMCYYALKAAEELVTLGINARVINIHTLRPLDETLIVETAKKTGCILTVEEHTVYGGLGSAVSEVISQNFPVPVSFIGIKDRCGESGETEELFEAFNLTAGNIVIKAKDLVKNKKSR